LNTSEDHQLKLSLQKVMVHCMLIVGHLWCSFYSMDCTVLLWNCFFVA